MQLALPMTPAQHRQGLALQRMAWPDDPHLLGIAIEVTVGSVSSIRSIISRFRATFGDVENGLVYCAHLYKEDPHCQP